MPRKKLEKNKKKRIEKKPKWREEKFLFKWNTILENKTEQENLKNYILDKYETEWINNAKFEKGIEDKVPFIKIFEKNGKNFATIKIVENENKAISYFDKDGKIYKTNKLAQLRINKGMGEDLIVKEVKEGDYEIYANLIVVENVVSSILLSFEGVESKYIEKNSEGNKELDILKLKNDYPEFQYDNRRFPGIVYRLGGPNRQDEPDLALLIFKSGSVICTGAGKEEYVKKAKEILKKKFKDLGIELKKEPEIVIQNIVASTKFYPKINLDILSEDENTEYEPEQFPGLIYKLDDPKTVMMVFRSGRIVVTGAKSTEDAILAAKKTIQLILHMNALIYE